MGPPLYPTSPPNPLPELLETRKGGLHPSLEGRGQVAAASDGCDCKGDCGAELNQILAGGPKLIYYNKRVYKM